MAGVGWWASPEIVYFLVPVVGLLAWAVATHRCPLTAGRAAAAAFAVGVGALPWIVDNVRTGWASFHIAGVGSVPHGSYADRLHVVAVDVLPMEIGLRAPGSGQ